MRRLRDGGRRTSNRERIVAKLRQLAHHRVTCQAQFAQDFADGAHNLGQTLGSDDNQRDCENQSYFKKVRQTSMTADTCNSMTSRRPEIFRESSVPCQLIIIPDWGVNDA